MGLTCRCFHQPSGKRGMGIALPSTTVRCSTGLHLPTSKHCKWVQKQVSVTPGVIVQEKQRGYGVTDAHKSVKHYPKVVLPMILKAIISKMPS